MLETIDRKAGKRDRANDREKILGDENVEVDGFAIRALIEPVEPLCP